MAKARIGIAAWFLIFSLGCVPSQATGPFFKPVDDVNSQIAVVYVYFPRSSSAANIYQGLEVNGAIISRLDFGGYYYFLTLPGELTLSLSNYSRSKLVLSINAEHKYFVKVMGASGLKGANSYWLVDTDEKDALDEIQKCRMMEPLKEGDECTGRWKHTLPVCQFNPDVEWVRKTPARHAPQNSE